MMGPSSCASLTSRLLLALRISLDVKTGRIATATASEQMRTMTMVLGR